MKFLACASGALALGFAASQPAAAADFAVDPSRLGNAAVRYRDAAKLAEFPVPVVSVRRGGLSAGEKETVEIKEKILYPLIERSRKAVSAVVLEWFPSLPDVLGITVVWSDGETRESLIPRGAGGAYADKAYEVLLAKPTP